MNLRVTFANTRKWFYRRPRRLFNFRSPMAKRGRLIEGGILKEESVWSSVKLVCFGRKFSIKRVNCKYQNIWSLHLLIRLKAFKRSISLFQISDFDRCQNVSDHMLSLLVYPYFELAIEQDALLSKKLNRQIEWGGEGGGGCLLDRWRY